MRLFGSDRIRGMMDTLGLDEDTPIDARLLSNAIENAQKTVESRNFQVRKSVLEYDDVMNTQREVIYDQRRQVLDGEDLGKTIESMMNYVVESEVEDAFGAANYCDSIDQLTGLLSHFDGTYYPKNAIRADQLDLAKTSKADMTQMILDAMHKAYAQKESEYSSELMREAERVIMLRVVDEYWMDHIDAMTDLRQGIGLRAYAQADPVVEYKREGYTMFEGMINAIREETVRRLFSFRLRKNEELKREKVAKVTAEGGANDGSVKRQPVVKKVKIGPNDPCPCGSGLKYKKCCRDKDLAAGK